MDDYLTYREACDWAQTNTENLAQLLIDKKFPLPVKSEDNKVVFHKNEVKKWLSKNKPGLMKKDRKKKNG